MAQQTTKNLYQSPARNLCQVAGISKTLQKMFCFTLQIQIRSCHVKDSYFKSKSGRIARLESMAPSQKLFKRLYPFGIPGENWSDRIAKHLQVKKFSNGSLPT